MMLEDKALKQTLEILLHFEIGRKEVQSTLKPSRTHGNFKSNDLSEFPEWRRSFLQDLMEV
jgi:hypothetical protein